MRGTVACGALGRQCTRQPLFSAGANSSRSSSAACSLRSSRRVGVCYLTSGTTVGAERAASPAVSAGVASRRVPPGRRRIRPRLCSASASPRRFPKGASFLGFAGVPRGRPQHVRRVRAVGMASGVQAKSFTSSRACRTTTRGSRSRSTCRSASIGIGSRIPTRARKATRRFPTTYSSAATRSDSARVTASCRDHRRRRLFRRRQCKQTTSPC